ncbi:ubiquitin hydrolase [Trypanosoma conorhini]|uniref:Ubiquitin hydrolase n=1 Tax=Trypanosoma conorhini TaxID=83891 RepID=A0A3R7KEP4_9TRYP|nr:ubiquitin hydrolase [Trypanosoma conorhini]RNF06439.1 ubiquitin hydrolase [Trypanosoma conorhini]
MALFSASFGGLCPSVREAPPPPKETRAGTPGAAATQHLRVAPAAPQPRRCTTAGPAGGASRAASGFAATTPPLPPRAGAGAAGSRWRAAPTVPLWPAFSSPTEPQLPARGRRGSEGAGAAEDGLQVTPHAAALGARPRVRDYAPRHAQLLSLEREQHRVATDRLHQRAQELRQKWTQEREAHAATTLRLFKAQTDLCLQQEESARHALAAAEAEGRLELVQRGGGAAAGKRRCRAHGAAPRVPTFPADSHAGPCFLYAYDSDLLRALQRSEAYIVRLERYFQERLHPCTEAASSDSACTHNSTCSEASEEASGGAAREGVIAPYAPLSPYIRTLT